MQNFNTAPARDGIANTKVSVPAGAQGKGVGLGQNERENDSPVDTTTKDDGGFTGGLINPMIK
jgi:hypothetical protein